MEQLLGDLGAAIDVAADTQHRVVAGDGTDDSSEVGVVDGAGEQVRAAGWRASHDQVARTRGPRSSSSPAVRISRACAADALCTRSDAGRLTWSSLSRGTT